MTNVPREKSRRDNGSIDTNKRNRRWAEGRCSRAWRLERARRMWRLPACAAGRGGHGDKIVFTSNRARARFR